MIPLLSELLDSFDKGELPDNEKSWFEYYPSTVHKERNSIAWIPYTELKGESEMRKKYWGAVLWGIHK